MKKLQVLLNNQFTGFVLATILPLVAVLTFHQSFMGHLSLKEFIDRAIKLHAFTKIVSLCVVPNLGLFFIFIWLDFLKTARGVLLATMLVAVAVFIVKLG
jgi:hypothetical protein